MGRRGPPPKPTALKVVQGTYRPDRAAPSEPRPEPSMPDPPEWLTPEALDEWDRVAVQLAPLKMITELDRTALALYCQAYADYVEAAREVARTGTTSITEKGNVIQHPAVGVRNQAFARLVKASAELGFTPASRSRVSGAGGGGQKPEVDPWDEFPAAG